MKKITSATSKYLKTSLLVKIAMLVSLSVVGSYIKFPGPVGSIALDSLPGYLGVIIIGGPAGALVLALGHLLSALNSGFVLGAIHFLIALIMGICGLIFSNLIKKNIYLAVAVTTFVNGVVSAAVLIPFFGMPFFYGTVPVLTTASFVNILLAVIIAKYLKDKVAS
ncbi:alpha-ribazole transporter [Halanaerobium saccharolyticum]|uniref:Alpha-ribazole transporter n=1 Tax=Halanaerobium saccharolyticum TaxID=43595 RepID=A0A4R6LU08_9FIRM|nr:ECF transporter S component [Halanaerobium saccharolyticum]TDO92161.1 alpha-ribazole transporter [Halanaerobium saccharolyticum]